MAGLKRREVRAFRDRWEQHRTGRHRDFRYDAAADVWVHPDTGVIIFGEDMPPELIPVCWLPHD